MQQSPYDPYYQPSSQQHTYYPPEPPTYIHSEHDQVSQWQQPYEQPSLAWQSPMIPPPPPPPARTRTRARTFVIVGILVLICIVGNFFVYLGQTGGTLPGTGTWTTTHTFTGNEIQQTATFSVSNDWKILWTCDPSSWSASAYSVQVVVYGDVHNVAINALCQSGNISGETEEHAGGNIYLKIISEAAWTILIQELR